MPTIEQNKEKWSGKEGAFEWRAGGDNWSAAWGSPANQWNTAILPRIQAFLPTTDILEIAPGYGRWTEFLRGNCQSLLGVDLSPNCVAACQERFAGDPRLKFIQNDGLSLADVPSSGIDFIFSFDSLVHCEVDVIDGYLGQFARILKPQGAAFLHHSNYAACLNGVTAAINRIGPLAQVAWRMGLIPNNYAWRAQTVSGDIVRRLCQKHGLFCARQEMVAWSHTILNDCLTTITRAPQTHDTEIIRNFSFTSPAKPDVNNAAPMRLVGNNSAVLAGA